MSILILLTVYAALLFFEFRAHGTAWKTKERILFLALSLTALLSAIPAGKTLSFDHIGASLSGMISLFLH